MMPLRSFESFLNEGIARRQRTDRPRAASLTEEAEKRKAFLKEMSDKIGVRNDNANYFIEAAYDTIMELVRARMLLDGFKAAGLNAHEAEVSYLRNMGFAESDIRFANDLRYFRNGIKYYGKRMDGEYAKMVFAFLDRLYLELVRLAREKL